MLEGDAAAVLAAVCAFLLPLLPFLSKGRALKQKILFDVESRQFPSTCVLTPLSGVDLVLLPPGAIEKLAKEDPRRARTGQVLDDRIAARRSELRKGTKKAKSKAATAAAAAAAAGEDMGDDGGEEEQEQAAAAKAGDSMDEDDEEGEGADGGGGGAERGGGNEDGDDDDDDDDDDDMEEEEAQEGLEEDNLRELLAGGRGKVYINACMCVVLGIFMVLFLCRGCNRVASSLNNCRRDAMPPPLLHASFVGPSGSRDEKYDNGGIECVIEAITPQKPFHRYTTSMFAGS